MFRLLSTSTVLYAILGGPIAQAQSFSFDVDARLIAGASWRTELRDNNLIAKRNIEGQGHICADEYTGDADFIIDALGGCTLDQAEFNEYINAPGTFDPNSDNGNLNYEKGEIVRASTRLLMDVDWTYEGRMGIHAQLYAHADPVTRKHENKHPDASLQPATEVRGKNYDDYALKFQSRELFAWYDFDVIPLSLKAGKMVKRWGEATFSVPNSVHIFNPPSLQALHMPGREADEIPIPVPMLTAAFSIGEYSTLELVKPLGFESAETPPISDFFSPTDAFGGGRSGSVSLGFGKEPEDPSNLMDGGAGEYGRPCVNPDGPIHAELGVRYQANRGEEAAGRTLCHAGFFEPTANDEWGAAFSTYSNSLNYTEFAFYAAEYYSRVPFTSYIAAEDGSTVPALIENIDVFGFQVDDVAAISALGLVDTAAFFSEYPKIKMYGLSFNSMVGDLVVSGELAYRPDAPVQVAFIDVSMFSLSPALGAARDTAAPSFLELYRRGPNAHQEEHVAPGSIIQGYERMKTYHWALDFLYVSSFPFLGADRMDFLLEIGGAHYPDMPDKEVLQFQANGIDTHASRGRSEYIGDTPYNFFTSILIQNPITEELDNFADSNSYGYRLFAQMHYNAFLGGDHALSALFIHDTNGESPQPAGNYIEGRRVLNLGWNYSRKDWSVRAAWVDSWGGGQANKLSDKAYASLSFQINI